MLRNDEAEVALLASILAGNGTVEDAMPLEAGDFGHPHHALVFRAMLHLHRAHQAINEVTVNDRLRAAGDLAEVGGPAFVMRLHEALPPLARPGPFAKLVREAAQRRRLREIAIRAGEMASDPTKSPQEAALAASGAMAALGAASTTGIKTFNDFMLVLLDRLDAVRKGEYQHYIKTRIDIWDELFGGLARGIVTLLPAYPSVGKGAVAGRMLLNLAQTGVKCALFSLEDPGYWLGKRFLADASGIPVRTLMSGDRISDIRENYLGEAAIASQAWGDNMLIDDRTNLSAEQIAATATQAIVQHGAQVVVIDNASEINVNGDDRHDVRSANMVRAIRDIAKNHDVAVLLLMHLKKSGNTTKEGAYLRPTTELLKNTTGFAEVARAIGALWRDEENKDEIICTILKQTEGERDIDFAMRFNASAGLVTNKGGRKRDGDKGYTEPRDDGRH